MMNNTGIYTCPVCPQNIRFHFSKTNITVCPSCKTPVKLLENNLLVSRKYDVINDNDSIFQPGTTGEYRGAKFTVRGRMRLWFDDAVYNYWTIEMIGGEVGLLAEAYGQFAIYQPNTLLRTLQDFTLDNTIEKAVTGLKSAITFFTQAEDDTVHWDIEGEVWMPADEEKIKVFELSGDSGETIAVLFFGRHIYRSFDVHDISLDALQLKNTRNTERSKQFRCPQCQSDIVLINLPYTQSCACKSCRSILQIDNKNNLLANTRRKTHKVGPTLAIGKTGELFGTTYIVIGWVRKIERGGSEKIYWYEYTLYHPEKGYRFLSEFEGHWIFVKELNHSLLPVIGKSDGIYWKHEKFNKYNQYSFEIKDAAGEFPFNAMANDGTIAYEFIAPPEMLIVERSKKKGVSWYHGQHVESSTIAKNFGASVHYKKGIGAIEPRGYINQAVIMLTYLKIAAVALVIHLSFTFTSKENVLLQNHFSFPKTALRDTTLPDSLFFGPPPVEYANSMQFVSDKFFLDKRRSNLKIEVGAMVNNSWFELGVTLVNATTGDEYAVEQGVEYYSGYTDGETWTEGDNYETTYLNSIPKGTYYLQLTGQKEPSYQLEGFDVKLTYDAPVHRNFLMTILLLAIWPLYKLIRVYYNDRARWYNSPYTPYTYNDE